MLAIIQWDLVGEVIAVSAVAGIVVIALESHPVPGHVIWLFIPIGNTLTCCLSWSPRSPSSPMTPCALHSSGSRARIKAAIHGPFRHSLPGLPQSAECSMPELLVMQGRKVPVIHLTIGNESIGKWHLWYESLTVKQGLHD